MSNFENKIKVTDLRINNRVKCKISNDNALYIIVAIDGINGKVMLSGARMGEWISIDNINPIPLTEDWLLKLGFSSEEYRDKSKHIGINFGQTDFTLVKPGSLDFEHIKHFGFEFDAGGWPRLKQFEYVHQLQNFFYFYTNEELEVKI